MASPYSTGIRRVLLRSDHQVKIQRTMAPARNGGIARRLAVAGRMSSRPAIPLMTRGRKTANAVAGIAERMLQTKRYQTFQSTTAEKISSRVKPLSAVMGGVELVPGS